MDTVDIIIPAYKPDHKFLALIKRLEHQSVPIGRIIVMNTEQKYFDRLVYGTSFQKDYHNVIVKHLSKREFDHGKTRNQGVQCSDAEYFVMMTQDAVPADEYVVAELLKQLHEKSVAVAYATAKQLQSPQILSSPIPGHTPQKIDKPLKIKR